MKSGRQDTDLLREGLVLKAEKQPAMEGSGAEYFK